MANSSNVKENLKVKVCSGHPRPVPHIAYSPVAEDSYWFVSSCLDGKPMIRNGETGDWVGTFEGHKGAVWMTCFNYDATRLATASGDYSAKLWNALDGTDLYTWPHEHCVKSVDWLSGSHGNRIATGCMDKHIRVYDPARPDAAPILLSGHNHTVKTALFLDSESIFSASNDNTLKKWDLRTNQQTHSVDIPDLSCVEYNRSAGLLVVASKFGVTLFTPWDLCVVRRYDFPEEVECAAISPDGRLFAIGSKLKVKEYDRASGTELHTHKGHHGPVFSVRYAPDSLTFASGSEDGMVRIWPNSNVLKEAEKEVGDKAGGATTTKTDAPPAN
eukprot:TRINITY_DN9652_c0_g1_i1.p1 TRINITY_DN9652_c0_g1~~TRINITY_DN9652_c0_g1_i1.p1  ORF type:complete len:330 (-),score=28.85 TRINITY_DN9652_c0_g1_i1:162-1151(-)